MPKHAARYSGEGTREIRFRGSKEDIRTLARLAKAMGETESDVLRRSLALMAKMTGTKVRRVVT
jgi:hypothetical protein